MVQIETMLQRNTNAKPNGNLMKSNRDLNFELKAQKKPNSMITNYLIVFDEHKIAMIKALKAHMIQSTT